MYYKVKVTRCSNTPKSFVVTARNSQGAISAAASQLREEGITDAQAIEVVGKVSSLRDSN